MSLCEMIILLIIKERAMYTVRNKILKDLFLYKDQGRGKEGIASGLIGKKLQPRTNQKNRDEVKEQAIMSTETVQEIPVSFEEMLKNASEELVSKDELRSRSYVMKGSEEGTYFLFEVRIYKATIL